MHHISRARERNQVISLAANQSSLDKEYTEAHDRSILIVDDDEQVRKLLANYLGDTYECQTACDAHEALAILATRPFALVLSDIRMPGLGGIELLRKIVDRYPETAVIMISGVDRTQRVIDAIRAGASDYLIKPIDLDVLALTIDRALERRVLLRNARLYKRDLEVRNTELAYQKSELQRLHEHILQSEKMASLGLMAAGVAHEINNPAGFIYSNVDVLQQYIDSLQEFLAAYDQFDLPAKVSSQIDQLKQRIDYETLIEDMSSIVEDCHMGAERIKDVVNNLRLFSRLDEADVKCVDLNEGIESTLRLLAPHFKAGPINVIRDYGELPQINCYAAQLNQVWMNLLVNAAQAIGQVSGEVRIRTRCEGSNVIVSITDTGKGIAPEDMKHIFDPFYTTKAVGQGTGLGLSISHGIIKKHRGTISVDGEQGSHTTFTIILPLDTEHP